MKIIFLDFDGVLNNRDFLLGYLGPTNQGIMPEKVQKLNAIIEETDAKIVFSTSWSEDTTLPELVNILNKSGFKYPSNCIGVIDPPGTFITKGERINVWLMRWNTQYGITRYVVIDDEADEIEDISNKFKILTSLKIGLNNYSIKKAIYILNEIS